MKNTLFTLLLAASFQPLRAQTKDADPARLIQQLSADLRDLRLELLEQRLDWQMARIATLEGEMRRVQADSARLDARSNGYLADAAEIDEAMATASTDQERAGLQASKNKLLADGPQKFAAQKSAMAQREAEVRQQLNQEQIQRKQLLERARIVAGR